MSKTILENLVSQIRQFGLNPQDWKLIPQGRREVRLVHRRDDSFRFVGFIDQKKCSWKSLALESL